MKAALAPAALLGGVVVLALTGCVEERLQSTPRPIFAPRTETRAAAPPLDEPIASPVLNSTSISAVRVAIKPMGAIAYDGLVLPVLSPDGLWAASQTGEPPTWPTLLAEDGAETPTGTSISIYDLSGASPRRVSPPEKLPQGLLLARGADGSGFLVEHPRPDGSRWIGHVNWVTGAIRWVTTEPSVATGAVLTASGDVVYTSRPVGATRRSLVLRGSGGVAVRDDPDRDYLVALASGEDDVVYALALGAEEQLELVAVALRPSEGGTRAQLGSIVARATIARRGNVAMAYQAASSVTPALPRDTSEAGTPEPLAILHPTMGRMAEFDRSSGGFRLLPPKSIAASRTRHAGGDGYFATTPQGLVFARASRSAEGAPPARVLSEPVVARPTINTERPMVLLGPGRRTDELRVFLMGFPAPEAEGPTR